MTAKFKSCVSHRLSCGQKNFDASFCSCSDGRSRLLPAKVFFRKALLSWTYTAIDFEDYFFLLPLDCLLVKKAVMKNLEKGEDREKTQVAASRLSKSFRPTLLLSLFGRKQIHIKATCRPLLISRCPLLSQLSSQCPNTRHKDTKVEGISQLIPARRLRLK